MSTALHIGAVIGGTLVTIVLLDAVQRAVRAIEQGARALDLLARVQRARYADEARILGIEQDEATR